MAAVADGSVVIEMTVDKKQAEKDLAKLNEKIEKSSQQMSLDIQKRDEAKNKAGSLGARLEKENTKLLDWQKYLNDIGGKKALSDEQLDDFNRQKETVKVLQAEFNKIDSTVDKYNAKIQSGNEKLSQMESEANETATQLERVYAAEARTAETAQAAETAEALTAQDTREVADNTAEARDNTDGFAVETNKAAGMVDKLKKRVVGLAKRVFIFSVITMALRSIRTWLSKVIKTDKNAASATAKLKGALLALAQPLVEIIIPAFTALVTVLAKVVGKIVDIFSALTGKNYRQSAEELYKETEALEGTGKAAEDAEKSLASFDEINQLSFSDADTKSDTTVTPDFNFDTELTDGQLKGILATITAIGTALGAWKLAGFLADLSAAEKDLTALGANLVKVTGLAIAAVSAFDLGKTLIGQWNNGVTWGGLKRSLVDTTGLATGLYLAFGKTGGAVGLVVGGFGMAAVGLHDMFTNGANTENTLMSMAGLFASGMGISALTGSFIPLLIGGVAAAALGFMELSGTLDQFVDGAKTTFKGLGDLVVGIFTLDFERAGKGFITTLEGVVDMADALTGHFFKITSDGLRTMLDGMSQMLEGFANGDWTMVWEGAGNVVKGICESILGFFLDIITAIVDGIQRIKNLFNGVGNDPEYKKLSGGALQSAVAGVPGKSGSLVAAYAPRLAQGAVIPPNREFMAVLGDQRSGTNVEAPLAMIKQAVAEEIGSGGKNGDIVLQIDGKTFARITNPYMAKETTRVGTKLVQGV